MIKIILALAQALKAGHELANPGAWKNVQAIASLLTALLAVLWALGYRVDLLPEDILAIAGVIAAIANAYLVIATSKKVGLPNADTTIVQTQPPEPIKPSATQLHSVSASNARDDPVLDECNPTVSASDWMRQLPSFGNNHKRPPAESGWNDR